MRVPPGFKVTLAAAEPDVRQPIAIAHDDRGRLWVAESYSYAGSSFVDEHRDRILILEDTNGDGTYDHRKIFHDRLNRLTGLVLGFGGVWVTTAPTLAFIPDRDGDDRPDGEPVTHLDGWSLGAEHNTVNGLTWGPDGWLYGRHGIKQPSLVGRPGTPPGERVPLSCAIWRYHPTQHRFDVVADGTINPWGLDFDDHGQAFISTSVIEHLWHVVPGVRFERWKNRGGHPNPHTYELMTATSDHLHWGGGTWDQGGRERSGNDALGGGHSHSDAMIYLGDRWPAEYRGSVLMSNIHGRRLNRDFLVRPAEDEPFRAVHGPDFASVADPWFRAISLEYGPDGDVVVTDWVDEGECHDRDGVHRSSGRIYKISYGEPRRVTVDLRKASLSELVALQLHRNDWYVRRARVLLQEHAAAGIDCTPAHTALHALFRDQTGTPQKLRALWALSATMGATPAWLRSLLDHRDEHIRHWAVRLLADEPIGADTREALVGLAARESSWLVRMALASALQRLEPDARWPLARALMATCSPASDPNLVRLLWYGLEPAVLLQPDEIAVEAATTRAPRLSRFVARRLAEAFTTHRAAGDALFLAFDRAASPAQLGELLAAAEQGLAGQRHLSMPVRAPAILAILAQSEDDLVRQAGIRIATRLDDSAAISQLRDVMNDSRRSPEIRTRALDTFSESPPPWLVSDLLALVQAGTWVEPAIRALAVVNDTRAAPALLEAFPRLSATAQVAVIDNLITRPASALLLLDAIGASSIARHALSPLQARQLSQLGNEAVRRRFDRVWGSVAPTSAETDASLARLRADLTPAALIAADLAKGAALFDQRCAICHVLFGRGQTIGPDLTGSGRKNLDYVLINVVDPNAAIPADYRMHVVTLNDGRTLSGTLASESDQVLMLRTMSAEVAVNRAEIKEVQRLPVSLMPAGLLDGLESDAVRDLVGYLMSDGLKAP